MDLRQHTQGSGKSSLRPIRHCRITSVNRLCRSAWPLQRSNFVVVAAPLRRLQLTNKQYKAYQSAFVDTA